MHQPLTETIMKVFPSGNLKGRSEQYNYCLSRARRTVKNVSERLKGQFRIPMKGMEARIKHVNSISGSLLHLA